MENLVHVIIYLNTSNWGSTCTLIDQEACLSETTQTQLIYQDVLLSVHSSHKHEFERGFQKLEKFTFFTLFLVGWNLKNLYKHFMSIVFCWHFKQETSIFLKASFSQNKKWLCIQNFVYNTLRLVRISLSKSFIYSQKSHFVKAIENFFPVFA